MKQTTKRLSDYRETTEKLARYLGVRVNNKENTDSLFERCFQSVKESM